MIQTSSKSRLTLQAVIWAPLFNSRHPAQPYPTAPQPGGETRTQEAFKSARFAAILERKKRLQSRKRKAGGCPSGFWCRAQQPSLLANTGTSDRQTFVALHVHPSLTHTLPDLQTIAIFWCTHLPKASRRMQIAWHSHPIECGKKHVRHHNQQNNSAGEFKGFEHRWELLPCPNMCTKSLVTDKGIP